VLKNGAKPEVISRILGYASVKLEGNVYRRVNSEEMRGEVDRHWPMSERWER
jgi:site-specific recombinase XerD